MNKKQWFTLGAVVGSSLASTGAIAAPAEDGKSNAAKIVEVIVTARRMEESLQDVPISITVFNQEQLTSRNITNATDLANFTPSLSANSSFGSENTTFAIRGFVQDNGTPPSVGTYFADVVAPRGPTQGTVAGDSLGPGSFFDLQNVQILKGPQGTLFGRNTTGGAILLVPQKPTSYFEGYAEASTGNSGMWRTQGALNAPIGDMIRLRLAVDHQERDGYLRNISGIGPEEYNNVDYTAIRGSAVLDLSDNIENYTIASYSKSDTNGSLQKMIACNPAGFNPPNPALGLGNFIGVLSCGQLASEQARGAKFHDVEAAVSNPVSLLEQWQVINTTTWNVSDTLTVKNVASYAEFKNKQRSPLFGTNWQTSTLPQPYPFLFFRGVPSLFTGIFPIPGHDSSDQSTYTEELQLQGSLADRRLTYQAGAYLEWSDPLSTIGAQSSQLAACTDLDSINCSDPIGSAFTAALGFPVNIGSVNYTAGETTYRNRGLYAQSSYELTDQVKLTGGLRYTWDEHRNRATRISYNFPVTPPFAGAAQARCTDPTTTPSCEQRLEQKSDKPTWLLGVDYKPTDYALLYAKYARGYRAGGVFTNAPIDHRTFEPEKVDNIELGVKTSFRAIVPATFNAALFYNDFSNQQLQFGFNARVDPVTGPAPVSPTTAIINAGKSRIYGAEVEASIAPIEGLQLELNYTYLSAEIRKIATVSTTDRNYEPQAATIPSGTPLVLSPENKYSLTGNYMLPLDEGIGRVSVGATFVHTDEQITTYAYLNPSVFQLYGRNLGIISGRDILNLNASWESILGSSIDVSAFATNVTDEEYYQWIGGLGSAGAEFAVLGEPRMYGVRLRYRFGAQ